jgi:nucleotide-binding universal stress UspA family protein
VGRPPPVVANGPLVVGVDESEHSRDAIALGVQLAQALPGELMLVYVHTLQELDALMSGHDPEEVEQLVAEHARAKHAKVSDLAAEMGISDLRLRRATSAAAGLHAQAAETGAALVIIGPSSRSGLGRVLPGATAEQLLSGSPVPVAVAPNGYASHDPGLELIGVGFNDGQESRRAAPWAGDLASRGGASLQVLAVHAPLPFGNAVVSGAYGTQTVNQVLAQELRSEAEKLADALSLEESVESHLFRGDPAAVLVERSQELDLLVLGSRGYGPLKSVLLGSVSSRVLRNAHCPVVVVARRSGPEPPAPSATR